MSKKFKRELSESIHESASALFAIGAISKATMRRFDKHPGSDPGRADQSPARAQQCQPTRVCALSEHQRFDGQAMGGRRQASQRDGAEVAEHRAEARS